MVSLLCTSIHSARSDAQETQAVCTLTAGELRDIALSDGTYGIVFPQEMVARHDSVLVLGLGGIVDARGNKVRRYGDTLTSGFLLTNGRRTATAIPLPGGMHTARYFRARASDSGWEAVFFVPDRDTITGTRMFDDGTLWYAQLRAGRWSGLEEVGHLRQAVVARPNSSGLVLQGGQLRFATFYGNPSANGGVLLWRREHRGAWAVDTLPMKMAPLSVSAAREDAPLEDARFYPVASYWSGTELNPGGLLSVSSANPPGWMLVRGARSESMNEPVEHVVGDTTHVSWWEMEQDAPPSLHYQPLDPRRENAVDAQRRVASGVNQFQFLAVPEGARTRLVWAYRPRGVVDSAEVAVVANGEPVVVGRVAFPFGFMTNGATSKDRSFVLATTPRPVPDGEPSASRTLEVRVNCRGAPGT
jgi:hypothetical protein